MIEKFTTQRWRSSAKSVRVRDTTPSVGKQESGASVETVATPSSEESKGEKKMKWREIIREALRPRTNKEIMEQELRQAELAKLEAETALEYACSLVKYNSLRIQRLQERLKEIP